jgi:hypothetical protein
VLRDAETFEMEDGAAPPVVEAAAVVPRQRSQTEQSGAEAEDRDSGGRAEPHRAASAKELGISGRIELDDDDAAATPPPAVPPVVPGLPIEQLTGRTADRTGLASRTVSATSKSATAAAGAGGRGGLRYRGPLASEPGAEEEAVRVGPRILQLPDDRLFDAQFKWPTGAGPPDPELIKAALAAEAAADAELAVGFGRSVALHDRSSSHIILDLLRDSAPLFMKRQCDRILARGGRRGRARAAGPSVEPSRGAIGASGAPHRGGRRHGGGGGGREPGGGGEPDADGRRARAGRARSHCRCVLSRIRFIP